MNKKCFRGHHRECDENVGQKDDPEAGPFEMESRVPAPELTGACDEMNYIFKNLEFMNLVATLGSAADQAWTTGSG